MKNTQSAKPSLLPSSALGSGLKGGEAVEGAIFQLLTASVNGCRASADIKHVLTKEIPVDFSTGTELLANSYGIVLRLQKAQPESARRR